MISNYKTYLEKRDQFVQSQKESVYRGQKFSQDFEKANKIFQDMLLAHRKSHGNRWFQTHTMQHKDEIEQDKIFKILKQMPKGAVHHLHGDCALDFDFYFKELAYQEHTFYNPETYEMKYFNCNSKVLPGFFQMKSLRDKANSVEEFEKQILNRLKLPNEIIVNDNINIWPEFDRRIIGLTGFLYNTHNYPKYLKNVLENFIKEGVQRVETKMFLGWIQDENEKNISWEQYSDIISKVINEIKVTNPEFSFGIIIQGLKMWQGQELDSYIRSAFEARKKSPELVMGFDMVQEEDSHQQHLQMAESIVKMQQLEQEFEIEMPLFLHGGESTNSLFNTNIFDNILLKCKRIGHGVNLIHHSYLLDIVKNEGICIEACPISNQVLKYVDDIRMHPLKTFLNYGIRVSISPDDPSFFGYIGASYDYFIAAVGCQLDLKDLKTIVKNTIDCSGLNENGIKVSTQHNEQQWDKFIEWFLKNFN